MSPTRKRRDEVYEGLKLSLEILASAAKISPVPGLEGIISTVTTILHVVEATKHNKQECHDISVRIKDVVDIVNTELEHGGLEVDERTRMRVGALESSLADICCKLSDLTEQNTLRRTINRIADASLIRNLDKKVDQCIIAFLLRAHVSTGKDIRILRSLGIHEQLSMTPVTDASSRGWCSDLRCFPETRTRYLNCIWEWVHNLEGPTLFWLTGVTDSGKSSISHEFAASLHKEGRHYSCMFFHQDDDITAETAIRHLAYGLSSVSYLREPILQAIEQINETQIHRTVVELFSTLVVIPLQQSSTCSTPIVLVIDGVDKCPADIIQTFLSAISTGIRKLPPSTARVFLTTCPDIDMRQTLDNLTPLKISVTTGVGMDDGDIEKYLKHELKRISEVVSLEKTWPTLERERDAESLAPRAGGLFPWAYILISVLENQAQPRDIRHLVTQILAVEMSSTPEANLDVLYTEALNIALPEVANDVDLGLLYRQVIGAVVASQEPLTMADISQRLTMPSSEARTAVRRILGNLRSVLVLRRGSQNSRGYSESVTVRHSSFRDYVTSQGRCPPIWFINP